MKAQASSGSHHCDYVPHMHTTVSKQQYKLLIVQVPEQTYTKTSQRKQNKQADLTVHQPWHVAQPWGQRQGNLRHVYHNAEG